MISRIYRIYRDYIYERTKHIRGFTRPYIILKELALRNVPKTNEDEEKDLFDEEWDNLIIVDACRQDYWEEETGLKGSRVSKASSTKRYVEKNYSEGDFSEYVYVAANPHFSDWRFEEITGRLPEDVFHSVFKTFKTDWDKESNTVLPEDTVRDALTAKKLFPDKKLIIHFLPPHYPFVRKPIAKDGINKELSKGGMEDSAWDLAESGKITHNEVEEAYRDNMNFVLEHVNELGDSLDDRTVLTSDHGNFVGEAGFYGHPGNRAEKPVKVVPWNILNEE